MNATPSTFEELEALCQRICHVLERENAILRSRNGLIGEGIEELEGIQAEKDSSIALLERASRDDLCISESRRSPERAERVRMAIGRCKDLQMRNHQIFFARGFGPAQDHLCSPPAGGRRQSLRSRRPKP